MKKIMIAAAFTLFVSAPAFATDPPPPSQDPCGCVTNDNVQTIYGNGNLQANVQVGDSNRNDQLIEGNRNRQVNVQIGKLTPPRRR